MQVLENAIHQVGTTQAAQTTSVDDLWKNHGQAETAALLLDLLTEVAHKAPTLAVLMSFMRAGGFLWKFTHFSTASLQFELEQIQN